MLQANRKRYEQVYQFQGGSGGREGFKCCFRKKKNKAREKFFLNFAEGLKGLRES